MAQLLRHVVFLVFAMGCGIGLDFYLKAEKAGDSYGLLDYSGQVGVDLTGAAESVGTFLNPPSLRKAMPSKLEGWEAHAFGVDDLAIVIGREPTPIEQEAFVENQRMKAIAMSATNGLNMVERAYYKGDVSIYLTAAHISAGGLRGSAMKAGINGMAEFMMLDKRPLVTVDGLAVIEGRKPDAAGGEARLIRAELTESISVVLLTRTRDDQAIAELVNAIDFPMLNELLDQPVAGIVDTPAVLVAGGDVAAITIPDPAVSGLVEAAADQATDQPADQPAEPAAEQSQDAVAPAASKGVCVRKAGVLKCTKG